MPKRSEADRKHDAASEPGSELERSIASEELARLEEAEIDVAFNVTDALGSVAGDEILPEIPIVKSLYALVKTSKAISNALLARKVVRFLFQLREISPEDRQAFLAKLEGDDRERIVDSLILVLERHEVLRKSEIQGRTFAALIREELSKAEYLTSPTRPPQSTWIRFRRSGVSTAASR